MIVELMLGYDRWVGLCNVSLSYGMLGEFRLGHVR